MPSMYIPARSISLPAACFKQPSNCHSRSMLWASSTGLTLLGPNKNAESSCLCPLPAEHRRYRTADLQSIVSYL